MSIQVIQPYSTIQLLNVDGGLWLLQIKIDNLVHHWIIHRVRNQLLTPQSIESPLCHWVTLSSPTAVFFVLNSERPTIFVIHHSAQIPWWAITPLPCVSIVEGRGMNSQKGWGFIFESGMRISTWVTWMTVRHRLVHRHQTMVVQIFKGASQHHHNAETPSPRAQVVTSVHLHLLFSSPRTEDHLCLPRQHRRSEKMSQIQQLSFWNRNEWGSRLFRSDHRRLQMYLYPVKV